MSKIYLVKGISKSLKTTKANFFIFISFWSITIYLYNALVSCFILYFIYLPFQTSIIKCENVNKGINCMSVLMCLCMLCLILCVYICCVYIIYTYVCVCVCISLICWLFICKHPSLSCFTLYIIIEFIWFILKPQAVPRSKQLLSGYKTQSFNIA